MSIPLGHGLIGFTRARIGMRPARGYTMAGPLHEASIHHGGAVGGPRMTFAKARDTWLSWQDYHMGKGWYDIGYNLGIDGLARLYQGRPVGILPAAVGYHNSNMVGIVFMQDGRFYGLNAAQRQTLKVLFEYGVPKWGLPPLKRLEVKGHKEYSGHASNECPGRHILRHLDWRRSRY
jgi:hypothetical protein